MSISTIEKLPAPVPGYPKLAHHMSMYSECAIFRRFNSLNCQNLLYLQAELVHLEERLRYLEAADSSSTDEARHLYSKDWYWLDDSESEQLEVVLEIRKRLKDYSLSKALFPKQETNLL